MNPFTNCFKVLLNVKLFINGFKIRWMGFRTWKVAFDSCKYIYILTIRFLERFAPMFYENCEHALMSIFRKKEGRKRGGFIKIRGKRKIVLKI